MGVLILEETGIAMSWLNYLGAQDIVLFLGFALG